MKFLNVPYAQKNEVKALGAKWNVTAERWYVPNDVDIAPFMRWIEHSRPTPAPVKAVAPERTLEASSTVVVEPIVTPVHAPAAPVQAAEVLPEKEYANIKELVRLLNREICFLDTETTSIICPDTPQVALVEFACLSFRADGTRKKFSTLINPGEIPIHWAAAKKHGITKKQVEHLQTFEKTVSVLNYISEKTILSGFNTRQFDVPVITQNYERYQAGQFNPALQLDVRDVWMAINKGSNKGTLGVVAEKYGVVPSGAHRALADVVTTIDILDEMISRHGMEMILKTYAKTNARITVGNPIDAPKEVSQSRSKPVAKAATVPSQAKEGVPVPKNTLLAEAGQYILDVVKKNGRVLPSDYAAIAAAVERTPQQVASKVSTFFENGVLKLDQIEDPTTQNMILGHLELAITAVGEGKLSPIKEYLDQKTMGNVDYLQLRIAMLYRQERLAETAAHQVEEEADVCSP